VLLKHIRPPYALLLNLNGQDPGSLIEKIPSYVKGQHILVDFLTHSAI